jgi:hypothetical protein
MRASFIVVSISLRFTRINVNDGRSALLSPDQLSAISVRQISHTLFPRCMVSYPCKNPSHAGILLAWAAQEVKNAQD